MKGGLGTKHRILGGVEDPDNIMAFWEVTSIFSSLFL